MVLVAVIGVTGLVAINFFWQLVKKPGEVMSLLTPRQVKTVAVTWSTYKSEFYKHSTPVMAPEFLAALAQVESAGSPVGTPAWQLNFKKPLFKIYAPASTSVGLMQFTNGTFERAKKYCIHNGKVKKQGRWYELNTCWFNGLYSRVFASDSIEVTSAFLHTQVMKLKNKLNLKLTKKGLQTLAAAIHLCGENRVRRFLKSSSLFKLKKCGSHSFRNYIKKIKRYQKRFKNLKGE